jgi:hypothetical protein
MTLKKRRKALAAVPCSDKVLTIVLLYLFITAYDHVVRGPVKFH